MNKIFVLFALKIIFIFVCFFFIVRPRWSELTSAKFPFWKYNFMPKRSLLKITIHYTSHCCAVFTFSTERLEIFYFVFTHECLVLLLMRNVNQPFVHNMKPSRLSPKGNISSLKMISYLIFPPPQSIHTDKHMAICVL